MNAHGRALAALNDVLPDDAADGTYAVVLAGPPGERWLNVIALGDTALPNGEHVDLVGAVTDNRIAWNRLLQQHGYPVNSDTQWVPSSGGTWTVRIN